MAKNGYTKLFYDFVEATSMLDDAEIGRLTKAIVKYARGESETAESELTGNERFVFPMFRLQIDRDAEKAEETAARSRDNGSKGGRPRKEEKTVGLPKNPENPVGFSETKKTHDKEKDNDYDYEKEKDLFAEDNARATAADTLEAYAANWITKLTPINMQELLSYRDSLTDEVIKHAIDRANGNGVSTYAYVKRILNGYVDANIHNMADAQMADRDFDNAKPARAAPVQKTGQDRFNYQQHTYTEADFGSEFYYDPLKDYGKTKEDST